MKILNPGKNKNFYNIGDFRRILFEGIKHIEDLEVREFINAIRNIENFHISEKLDGANLVFGFDEDGRFFTSREGKGGERFYKKNQWENKFWATGFRAAHVFLESISDEMKPYFKGDSSVEAEILFGSLPNTVPYSNDENFVVILRKFHGDVDVEGLIRDLDGRKKIIQLDNVPTTFDGKTISYVKSKYVWRITKVPVISIPHERKETLKRNLEKKLEILENYLRKNSGIGDLKNIDVLIMKLNVKPKGISKESWEEYKEKIKIKREEIEERVQELKLSIKETLLDEIVRKLSSKFAKDVEDGWIEGVVFRSGERGEEEHKIFKLVDKDFFTAQNKFNWKIREMLSPSGFRKWNSVNNKLRESIKKIVDPTNLININRKPRDEEIEKAAKYLENKGIPIDFLQEEVVKKLVFYRRMIDRLREIYLKNYRNIKVNLKRGSEDFQANISDALHKKNLEAFAELAKRVDDQIKNIRESKTHMELVYHSFFN